MLRFTADSIQEQHAVTENIIQGEGINTHEKEEKSQKPENEPPQAKVGAGTQINAARNTP